MAGRSGVGIYWPVGLGGDKAHVPAGKKLSVSGRFKLLELPHMKLWL